MNTEKLLAIPDNMCFNWKNNFHREVSPRLISYNSKKTKTAVKAALVLGVIFML